MYAIDADMKHLNTIYLGTPQLPSLQLDAYSFGRTSYEMLKERGSRLERELGLSPERFFAVIDHVKDPFTLTTMVDVGHLTSDLMCVNRFLDSIDSPPFILSDRNQNAFCESAARIRERGYSIQGVYAMRESFLHSIEIDRYMACSDTSLEVYAHGWEEPYSIIPFSDAKQMLHTMIDEDIIGIDIEKIKDIQHTRYQSVGGSRLAMYRRMVHSEKKDELHLISQETDPHTALERLDEQNIRDHFPFTSSFDKRFLSFHILGTGKEE